MHTIRDTLREAQEGRLGNRAALDRIAVLVDEVETRDAPAMLQGAADTIERVIDNPKLPFVDHERALGETCVKLICQLRACLDLHL